MASVNDRLGRLERRRKPRRAPDPELAIATSAVCKSMNAYRRELDGLPLDPANEFTEAEVAFDRQATREFHPWLEAERSRAHPKDWPHLDEWIEHTKGEIAKLDEEAALESRPKAGAKR